MNIASEETQARVTAEDLAEIFGVGEMTDEQREQVEKVLGMSQPEATTKERAARPMSTQKAARKALEKETRSQSLGERKSNPDRTAGGNPAGGSLPARPDPAPRP